MSENQAGRLLRLLSLLQTPREWPGGELAERLGVTRRTVRRDVERLRDLGYPVRATRGVVGGYRLAAGSAMPPLLLDDEEAVAIAVGLRTAADAAVAGIEESSLRALAKLEQVLPARLRRRVAALGLATVPLWPGGGDGAVDPEALAVLAGAAAGRERLRFGYRAADGRESRRLVEPYRLVAAWRRWYLLAFDVERDDWRVFRVDRIAAPAPTGVRVAPREPPDGDAAAFVTRRLASLRPRFEVEATLRLPAAEAARRLGAGLPEPRPIDAESCELRGEVDESVEWLAARLVTLGCEFTVRRPPELVDQLRGVGERALRATRGSGG
ncbi:helix-turn-helix transcriptional regulator [Streptomyces hainanensis]|uniref:WYL domain-containing protein n=1 Tax=Streptomyces hainanensis TaxID=402648 RepID=A0A4R4T2Q0_9ACTN|nr:WYL domain-containing protein [Streptomyces hainanensis]TDC69504.1 WYL domain-containing protein [Streptomyces hainanensis]